MPRTFRLPLMQHHRASGQARVKVNGRDVYLGPHGTEAAKRKHQEIIRGLLTDRERTDLARRATLTTTTAIAELIAAYFQFARGYYVKGDRVTNEYGLIVSALEPVLDRHGADLVTSFGPMSLKAIRAEWVAAKLVRSSINKRVDRIRRCFAWGVEQELVPVEVLQALRAVKGLAMGRTEAKEGIPVKPVEDCHVDAVRPFVSRQVSGLIEVQRLTGCRPGEAVQMRGCDLDMAGTVWTFTPESHKCEHLGKPRVIHIGPKCQEVIRPFLKSDPAAYLFRPVDAMTEFRATRADARKTRRQPSQLARKRMAHPKKAPRAFYTTTSYNRAIREGIKKANAARPEGSPEIPHWSVHRLRHTAATRIRATFDVDTARTILGHSALSTTAIYAEADQQKAADAMARVG